MRGKIEPRRFFNAEDLLCDTDEVSVEAAKQLVDGHDVELWQRHRKVEKFEAKPVTPTKKPRPG